MVRVRLFCSELEFVVDLLEQALCLRRVPGQVELVGLLCRGDFVVSLLGELLRRGEIRMPGRGDIPLRLSGCNRSNEKRQSQC